MLHKWLFLLLFLGYLPSNAFSQKIQSNPLIHSILKKCTESVCNRLAVDHKKQSKKLINQIKSFLNKKKRFNKNKCYKDSFRSASREFKNLLVSSFSSKKSDFIGNQCASAVFRMAKKCQSRCQTKKKEQAKANCLQVCIRLGRSSQ